MNENLPVTQAEQRRRQYKETKRESDRRMREERRREKAENREDQRLLAFLKDIILSQYPTIAEFADRNGMTRQGVWWIFSKDDCMLSKAEELVGLLGYRLGLRLEDDPQKETPTIQIAKDRYVSDNVQIQIEGDIVTAISRQSRTHMLPDYVKNCPETSRMRWLADLIIETKTNLLALSEMVDINYPVLRMAFLNDDIRITRIRDIAAGTGKRIIWSVKRV